MPDRLWESIEQAIQQPLGGQLFERCAVDLLRQNSYRNLRGTPHGHDVGMDGIAGPDEEPEFFLVVTTAKDFAGNLRQNVKRYVEGGGPCRTVVLATTQAVTVERRRRLQEELQNKWGAQLRAVHDRGEFVQLLYNHPQWRKDLLGVAGATRALSRFPANSRPTPLLPLIGRDHDLERLRAVSGDLVLVGRPGVGKTFLLEQLASEDWGFFDAGRDIADLGDAILEMQPQRVVIDDAHLAADRLPEIRRVRREMEASFDIVAVSWPGQADTVARKLPEAERIDVEELERDQILQVIEEAGVAGPPDLQRLIVDQSHGCVGLAVTLACACVGGRGGDVVTGEALLADLAGWYKQTLGPESHHVLGVLALAGDNGATLEQVREFLDLSLPKSSDLIRGLASGGTLDEAPHLLTLREDLRRERSHREPRMRVQPEALRYALVRNVFFSDLGSLYAARAIDWPGPSFDRCHPAPSARRTVARTLTGGCSGRPWTGRTREPPPDTHVLARPSCRRRLMRRPRIETPIAEAAYKAGVDPAHALQVLMEQAVGDDRAKVQHAGAPAAYRRRLPRAPGDGDRRAAAGRRGRR